MRAPDAPIYNAAERSEIARLAKLVGYDADQRRASGLPRVPTPPMTLIETLECSALVIREVDNVISTIPTPKQRTRLLREQLAEIEKFQRSIGTDDDDVVVRSPEFEKLQVLHKRLHDALTDVVEFVRGEVADLSKAASYSPESARRPEVNAFQTYVLNIWRKIGGAKASRSLTIDFVFACTHPVFRPGKSRKSVENLFDRHN
jgi:hypothetical protein